MLEVQPSSCPNCSAPVDADAGTCPYCYAHIPHLGMDKAESETTTVAVFIMMAIVMGLCLLDLYLGTGVIDWIIAAVRALNVE